MSSTTMMPASSTADLVREQVQSISTCTPSTLTLLNDLLLPKPIAPKPTAALASKKPSKLNAKTTTTKTRTKNAAAQADTQLCEDILSPRQRSILATEVINATLKTLTDAIRASAQKIVQKQSSSKDLVKATARRTLRRSNSVPQTPLQSRTLSRVSSSPDISSRHSRSSSTSSVALSKYRSTAECTRTAFACLRSLQVAKALDPPLPPLQLENGMSVLIGKLITLGLDDLAIREIRLLKRRLLPDPAQKKTATAAPLAAPTFAELLDFDGCTLSGPRLMLAITTQLHILRVLGSSRKHFQIVAAIPVIASKDTTSPLNLALLAAAESSDVKHIEKLSKHLQAVSEVLLSLCPSISSSEDTAANEPRLSVAPEIAIKLQAQAFKCRQSWWKLAGHKGDTSKELLDPLIRCLTAYARRSDQSRIEIYNTVKGTLEDLVGSSAVMVEKCDKTTTAGLYRLLASAAKDAGMFQDAINWTTNYGKNLLDGSPSNAQRCAYIARLISLKLRHEVRAADEENLILELLKDLENPFKGSANDIDDMVAEVSLARRAAGGILTKMKDDNLEFSASLKKMCEELITVCPKLLLRYLGSPPKPNSTTKEMIRYSQLIQLVAESAMHTIDSVLFLVKQQSIEGQISWDVYDSRLQECLLLHRRIFMSDDISSQTGHNPPAYHVRISNLYYSYYLKLRNSSEAEKVSDTQQLRCLRRSTDCIRGLSQKEKVAACLCIKLQRLADCYKQKARYDELLETLIEMRNEYVEQGFLQAVADISVRIPIALAWANSEGSAALANVIKSIAKTCVKYSKRAEAGLFTETTWSDEQRATVLEQLLSILSDMHDVESQVILRNVMHDLLSIYHADLYPYRRLRTLTNMYAFELNRNLVVVDNLEAELMLMCHQELVLVATKDSELMRYVPNMSMLAETAYEVRQIKPDLNVFARSLTQWSTLCSRCKTLEELQEQVEDISLLVTHLATLSDFFQVKGCDELRLSTLRLVNDINHILGVPAKSDALVRGLSTLGLQWLVFGYSGKAGMMFDKAKELCQGGGISSTTTIELHISYAQYLLAVNSHERCEEQMHLARKLFLDQQDTTLRRRPRDLQEKVRDYTLAAKAFLISAELALERGTAQLALSHAKSSVRLLRRAWAYVESQQHASVDSSQVEQSNQISLDESTEISLVEHDKSTTMEVPQLAPYFWSLVGPLHAALSLIGKVYTFSGLYSETHYYLQEANKIASIVGSEYHNAKSALLLGSTYIKADLLEKASQHLALPNNLIPSPRPRRMDAMLLLQRGILHSKLGDHAEAIRLYESADRILEKLLGASFLKQLEGGNTETAHIVDRLSQLTLTKPKKPVTRKAIIAPKSTTTRKITSRSKTPVEPKPPNNEQCILLAADRELVLRQKAKSLAAQNQKNEASKIIQQIDNSPRSQSCSVDHKIMKAEHGMQEIMHEMAIDPVYSVLQESTLSYPAISSLNKAEKFGDRLSVVKASPPARKASKSAPTRPRSKSPDPSSYFNRLKQIQEQLLESHLLANINGNTSIVHHVTALLNSVTMMLSAFGQSGAKLATLPGFSSCSIETARNLALRRERRVIHSECSLPTVVDSSSWPSPRADDRRRSSMTFSNDNNRFQQNYIDIIPSSWTTISIALSDSKDELSITKFQANHGPFVLRLPLGRHNSMDPDEDVFGFEHGRSELLEIIKLTNESAHDARDMTTKDAREAWWNERELLDARLRDLLENMEKVWLGGFTGIFSQHTRRSDLSARFQKSFHNILDRHLPSRRKSGKKAVASRITLDLQILELFIGLGDATDEELDLSEPLADLLNFVVDVLQFNGEQNEYAEIDFDSMVVETQDALRGYHAAVHAIGDAETGKHTILILDKDLHAFPWESLPCMQDQAVSRLPSLSSLRDRILLHEEERAEGDTPGHYIHRNSGSYILNPGGDLRNTQAMFAKPLQSLMFDGIVRQIPKEEEIKAALMRKDLYLYFGHGSGAQYIRAKEIRRLDKCAVTWLMGCSSGALANVCEFEPYGPALNYMQAGCPALVATLWDVTDKDIDRFAKSAFEEWGLFEGKGKGKGKKMGHEEKLSLVEAVSRGREACNLRYLNAAAVVVYGVPVYFR